MSRLPQKHVRLNSLDQKRQPLLITKDSVFLPPGETDENKRQALQTWERAQEKREITLRVRYVAYAVASALALLAALL